MALPVGLPGSGLTDPLLALTVPPSGRQKRPGQPGLPPTGRDRDLTRQAESVNQPRTNLAR